MRYHRLALLVLGLLAIVGASVFVFSHTLPWGRTSRRDLPPLRSDNAQEQASVDVHEEKPESLNEIPSAFYGDVTIRGRVVGVADTDARVKLSVRCYPYQIVPVDQAQREVLKVAVGSEGRFSFANLPRRPNYVLHCMGESYFGRTRIEQVGGGVEDAVITVSRIFYERLHCVDSDGAPVDSSLVTIRSNVGAFSPLYSTIGQGDAEFASVLPDFGVKLPLADGRVAMFSLTSRFAIVVAAPGFKDRELDLPGVPVSKWPAERRIELEKRPIASRLTVYHVAWPDVRAPADWGDLGAKFVVFLRNKATGVSRVVTRERRSFVAERGVQWDVRPPEHLLDPHAGLPYTATESAGHTLIQPEYPKYGFVTLRYDANPGESVEEVSLTVDRDDIVRPSMLYPGHARIGPIPIGEHELARVFVDSQGGRQVLQRVIVVHEGHREIKW